MMTLSPERRAIILSLLQSGPKLSAQVQAVLRLESSSVRKLLSLLQPEVKRIGGPTRYAQWALASYSAPIVVVQKRTINPASKMHPKPKPRLAKPQTPSGPLPWWATAAREGFTALAAERAEQMRNTKEYFWVPNRFLE